MPQDDPARIGKLVLSADNRVLREVLIDRKRLTIGRRPHNDLLLDDLTVSGEHAIVHTVAGQSVIQDLMSRNGTLINGAPAAQQQLAHGDCIDVGIYRLVYKIERVAGRRSTYGFWSAFMPTAIPPPTNLAGQRTSAWVPSRPSRYPGPPRPEKQGTLPNPGLTAKPVFRGILPKPGVPATPGFPGNPVLPASAVVPPSPVPPAIPLDPPHAASLPPTGSVFHPLVPRPGDPAHPRRSPGFSGPARPAGLPLDHSSPASLRFLGGHEAGRRMLLDRPIVSIRNGFGQVAVVAMRTSGYFVTHLEGPAYPLVNGESIGLGAHRLSDNDLIELAGTILQFSLER